MTQGSVESKVNRIGGSRPYPRTRCQIELDLPYPAGLIVLFSLLILLLSGLSFRFSALVDRFSVAIIDSILLGTLPSDHRLDGTACFLLWSTSETRHIVLGISPQNLVE